MLTRIKSSAVGFAGGFLIALALVAVVACGGGSSAVGIVSGDLEIRDAHVRRTPGMGSIYLTVVNRGSRSDRLVKVEADAQRAETHESLIDGGVVRMVARPEGFEIPAGGRLVLEPGGKHIMLVEPGSPEDARGAVRIVLHFEHTGAVAVMAEPLSGDAADAMDHSKMDHSTMDHSTMDHSTMDHSKVDHSTMDHSKMDHGAEGESQVEDPAAQDDGPEDGAASEGDRG
jgi:periplasmic copper chaperone A